MKVMILAAGFGKRLLPLTEVTPKPLLKIGDKTLIQHNIDHLIANGFSEFVINISHLGHLIEDHINEEFSNLNITFSREDSPLGTGGGILNALSLLGNENFLVINSDIFHQIDLKSLPNKIDAAHLIGVPNPTHNELGDFSINENNIVVKEELNNLTWSGISVINPKIFTETNFVSSCFNIWDTVFPKYLKNGNVSGQMSSDLWIDVGTHERLKLANSLYNNQN